MSWLTLVVANYVFTLAAADFTLYNSTNLVGAAPVSSGCTDALSTSIACDELLLRYATANYVGAIDTDTLSTLCTSECSSSLATFNNNVATSCASDPDLYPGLPATYTGDFIWAYMNQTCLIDSSSGTYCTNYFANLTIPSDASSIEDLPSSELCSPCFISTFQQAQSTGFSDYGNDTALSWAKIQSICSLSASPTTVPDPVSGNLLAPFGNGTGANTTVSSYQPPSCLSGTNYTVASGDDCQKIAQQFNVSTGTLEILNGLYSDCSNLEAGQELCLPQTCQTYLVQQNDTCYSIAQANSILFRNIPSYNAALNSDCTNLIAGQNICLSPPAGQYTPTVIAGIIPTPTGVYATSTVLPPGPVATGTTRQCGTWYDAMSGDTCDKVCLNQTIQLDLFLATNPSINENCTNLLAGVYYCTQPTEGWAESPTVVEPAPTTTPSGTTATCYNWHTVVSGDGCYVLENDYGITMDQLVYWNPSLDSDCGNLALGEAYCVSGPASNSTSSKIRRSADTSGGLSFIDWISSILG